MDDRTKQIANEPPLMQFFGATFVPEFDAERLTGQLKRVWDVMKDGGYFTYEEIQEEIQLRFGKRDSIQGISARTRDFRKEQYGSHTVNSRRRGCPQNGLWEYELVRTI
jgi:hypothetical protein